jgi:hypothetical protein
MLDEDGIYQRLDAWRYDNQQAASLSGLHVLVIAALQMLKGCQRVWLAHVIHRRDLLL